MFGTTLDDMGGAATTSGRVLQRGTDRVAQRARRDLTAHICHICHIWFVVVSVVLTAGVACSTSRSPQADALAVPRGCSGDAVCVGGSAVYACRGGLLAEVLDDCEARGKVCSLARCTSSDCQTAETNSNSLLGCLFYTLEADNVTADEGATTSFLITNPGDDPAAVELQYPSPPDAGGATQWSSATSVQVATGQSGRLLAGLPVIAVGTSPNTAIRVSSDRPVTVVEIESDDASESATSSGGTMVLPLQSLGVDYRAVTYPQAATPAIASTPGSRGGAGRVMIVGTQMGTRVHLKPFAEISADPGGGTPRLEAGDDYAIALDDGDVFQIYTGADAEDLTGSRVTADQPIAVFSGNISTTYGSQATGINSPDLAHEQMPPLATWSRMYVAAALTPQASVGCTSFFGLEGASIWRVVASTDDTQVSFDVPSFSTLQLLTPATLLAEPLVQPLTLGAGEARSLLAVGSFTVTASNPILVTQGLDCEPSLSLAIAADSGALLEDLRFAVLPNFDQLLGVVRPRGAEVDLDGVAIPDELFQTAGSLFEVAGVPLAVCAPAASVCTHHLTASRGFGMTLRGMDVESSYALTAPALVGCDPVYEVCLN
jgi:hypothetical protein